MEKFEYRILKCDAEGTFNPKIDFEDVENRLNWLGKEGWELVNSFINSSIGVEVSVTCILKRKID